MIVAMSCNENWYKYLVVDIYSLLRFTKNVKKIYLLVETEKINDIKYLDLIQKKFPVEIELINYNNIIKNYLVENSPNRGTIFTDFCFARLILADYVKEDRVIYLDTDAIVRKDISHLWNIDITNYYVCGVRDYGVMADDYLASLQLSGRYINSGMVLFNLKKIREDKIISQWFNLINNKELRYPDQDALNIVCTDHELYLPSMYNFIHNVTVPVFNQALIKVFHYAGEKNAWVADRFYGEEWYDSAEMFYDEIIKMSDEDGHSIV